MGKLPEIKHILSYLILSYLIFITNTSREFGLEINREKSSILIFNMKEQPDELMGIQVVQSTE